MSSPDRPTRDFGYLREHTPRLGEALASVEGENTPERSSKQRWFHNEMTKAIMEKIFPDSV